MHFITRKSFIDKVQSSVDVQRVLSTFIHLYHLVRAKAKWGGSTYCSVSAEVWGFPRADGQALLESVRAFALSRGMGITIFALLDPDTIKFEVPPCSADLVPDFAPWFQMCLDAPINGLACMFRLTVKDSGEPGEAITKRGGTL